MTEPLILRNPAQDDALADAEREYARKIIHQYAEIVRKGEDIFSDFCQQSGVPEDICMRAQTQVLLHRAGTMAAHILAEHLCDDTAVTVEKVAFGLRLQDVVQKQIPLSRKTVERIGPRP